MERSQFIAKLVKNGKISLISPGRTLSDAFGKKARSSLAASRVLLQHGFPSEAISLAYFAMYHETTAFLYRIGVKCTNHTAVPLLAHDIFKIDVSRLVAARRSRLDAQYTIDIQMTEREAILLIESGQQFIDELDATIDRLSTKACDIARESVRQKYFESVSSSS
jgi:uncharacterized protein (UPF0332 family)